MSYNIIICHIVVSSYASFITYHHGMSFLYAFYRHPVCLNAGPLIFSFFLLGILSSQQWNKSKHYSIVSNQSINQSISQSINQSINQSIDRWQWSLKNVSTKSLTHHHPGRFSSQPKWEEPIQYAPSRLLPLPPWADPPAWLSHWTKLMASWPASEQGRPVSLGFSAWAALRICAF